MTHPHLTQWRTALAEKFPSTDIEKDFDIGAAVYAAYERGDIGPLDIHVRGTQEEPRRYLGASQLGQECMRKTWAQWRGLTDGFPGRIKRLFRTGDIYEERMRHELRAIGFTMFGDQAEFTALDDRVKGHSDGCAGLDDLPIILWEAKTGKHSRVLKLKKLLREEPSASEALKKWDRKYWGQTHTYMKAFRLHVCLFEVTDKDTDEIVCFLFERDAEAVRDTGHRAETILTSVGPPVRGFARAKTPGCTKFCDAMEWCWNGAPLPRACGSCIHWRDGWCTKFDLEAHRACEHYTAVPRENEGQFSEWEVL